MRIEPSRERFCELGAHQRVIGVHTRLLADHLTPIAIYQRLCGDRELTFLLESAEAGVWSRWSFIGVRAASTLLGKDDSSVWLGREVEGLTIDGEPLDVLTHVLDVLGTPDSLDATDAPPFSSGMVGYLAYDIVRRLEKLPDSNPDDLGVPDLIMMLASDLAIYDHLRGEVWLVANAINFDNTAERVEDAYADAVNRVEAMAQALAAPSDAALAWQDSPTDEPVVRQRSDAEFEGAVVSAVEEILAGEAFQIVVSQRFDLPTDADALTIYRELRNTNPSPYLYLLRLPGFSVVGSSPEALVTVIDGVATTHPIAGTRPRGSTPHHDVELEHELLADPKERAEHLMLVDLGRNDLGRVCEPGSIEVTEFMQVRRYSHVMHLEAAVVGRVAAGRTALDVTLACFPAGTLSGAPKVRAMEIIDSLEVTRRGVYGGVVGYFDFAGNGDSAIAIRTALLKDGIAHVQAGGGIVADSVPALENAESQNKAAAALNAVRRAGGLRGLSEA
ncbi:MAG TPA: anthranilate synthase component I [Propionibacteriaceae bacterium]|nr:anthranilate synthase component I [Propionibacteriaceae bacterium]